MFRVIALFVFIGTTCSANVPVPAPAPPQVYCGYIPDELYSCAHLPSIFPHSTSRSCAASNECEKYTCVAQKSGWLVGTSVNNTKLSEHLDAFLSEHSSWTDAVQQSKTTCLVQNLPAQGFDVNCPAFDVFHCLLTTFIKNVPASLWSTSASCAGARQFAAACPLCPAPCFAPAVPAGSCNACRALPRSP